LELIDQDDRSIGEVDLGASARILNQANELLFFVAHRAGDPNNGDNTIGIFMNTESMSSSLPHKLNFAYMVALSRMVSFMPGSNEMTKGSLALPLPMITPIPLGLSPVEHKV
jgi:hypothetical protein